MKINIVYQDSDIYAYESDIIPRQGDLLLVHLPAGAEELFEVEVVTHELRVTDVGKGVQESVNVMVKYEGIYDPGSEEWTDLPG